MNEKLFREIESRYYDLKAKADMGEISPDQYKAELKKLMIQDETGRYWMIGGKSGGWYMYENNSWQASSPYSFMEQNEYEGGATEAEYMAGSGSESDSGQAGDESSYESGDNSYQSSFEDSYGSAYAPAADTSYESAAESSGESSQELSSQESYDEESSLKEEKHYSRQKEENRHASIQDTRPREKTVPCRFCGSHIPVYSQYCPHCGGNQKKQETRPSHTGVSLRDGEMIVRSLNLLSLFLLFGFFGVFFGLIAGATFGIFKIGGDLIYQFPQMMQDAHGKAQGGLIFGALGGLGGGFLFGFFGVLFGLLFNTAIIFMKANGGVRIKIKT